MSHHFDSPTAIEDGRLNLCDLYAFPGPRGSSTLVLTVNPDAGRSSATTFRPDALYEFVIASDGGTVEDRAFRMTFDDPTPDGRQHMSVSYAQAERCHGGTDRTPLGTGSIGDTVTLDNGGLAWFGMATDPFWADGPALLRFLTGLARDEYVPDVITADPTNVFAARNVTAVAVQVPDASFGGADVSLWARISLYGHAPQQQVSRMGNPMLRPLFFPVPGADVEALNAGSPATDVDEHGPRLQHLAMQVARLRHLADPAAHAASVQQAFLPDVLHFRPGHRAHFAPGTGNGRALNDDAFGISLSVLHGDSLGMTPSPHASVAEFPHLLAPDHSELPALADLFGLRALVPNNKSKFPTAATPRT